MDYIQEQINELKELVSEIEDFDYGVDEADNLERMCKLCDKDMYESCEIVDEEYLKSQIDKYNQEWEFNNIRMLLEDINLDSSYWILDWYWRPRDVERVDSECIADEKIKELNSEIEYLAGQQLEWEEE